MSASRSRSPLFSGCGGLDLGFVPAPVFGSVRTHAIDSWQPAVATYRLQMNTCSAPHTVALSKACPKKTARFHSQSCLLLREIVWVAAAWCPEAFSRSGRQLSAIRVITYTEISIQGFVQALVTSLFPHGETSRSIRKAMALRSSHQSFKDIGCMAVTVSSALATNWNRSTPRAAVYHRLTSALSSWHRKRRLFAWRWVIAFGQLIIDLRAMPDRRRQRRKSLLLCQVSSP